PPLEGDPEHLSQQVLGLSRVDAAGQETQERGSVPVEDDTEDPRRLQRTGDHGTVCLLHFELFPVPPVPVRVPVKIVTSPRPDREPRRSRRETTGSGPTARGGSDGDNQGDTGRGAVRAG